MNDAYVPCNSDFLREKRLPRFGDVYYLEVQTPYCIGPFYILVKVLEVKPGKCDVMPVASDNTTFWVDNAGLLVHVNPHTVNHLNKTHFWNVLAVKVEDVLLLSDDGQREATIEEMNKRCQRIISRTCLEGGFDNPNIHCDLTIQIDGNEGIRDWYVRKLLNLAKE